MIIPLVLNINLACPSTKYFNKANLISYSRCRLQWNPIIPRNHLESLPLIQRTHSPESMLYLRHLCFHVTSCLSVKNFNRSSVCLSFPKFLLPKFSTLSSHQQEIRSTAAALSSNQKKYLQKFECNYPPKPDSSVAAKVKFLKPRDLWFDLAPRGTCKIARGNRGRMN